MASPKSAYSLAKILRSRYGTQHPPHAERCSHSHTRNQFRHQFGPFGDEQSRCVPPFLSPSERIVCISALVNIFIIDYANMPGSYRTD